MYISKKEREKQKTQKHIFQDLTSILYDLNLKSQYTLFFYKNQ